MSKAARKAKQAAQNARDVRRAGIAVLLTFTTLLMIGGAGGMYLMHFRQHRHGPREVLPEEESLVDLENPRCPTCGNATAADLVIDWHHLRIRLAHDDCRTAFSAAPQRVLDSSGMEWRRAARLAHEINHGSDSARKVALTEAEDRWRVLLPGTSGRKP